MIRIIKGGFTFECDTQADVKLAMAVFTETDEPALPPLSIEVNGVGAAPEWRVGGPVDRQREPLPPIGSGIVAHYPDEGSSVSADQLEEIEASKPKLVAVDFGAPQHITVSKKNREVLDAVILFSEGVSTASLATLLGLKQVTVASRIQGLKAQFLVEKIPNHRLWHATTLARRAKLVTG